MASVGQLVMTYPVGWGTCTGTVVTKTLVITAAHCVSDSAITGVFFVPGQYRANDAIQTPYGVWKANNWWTPQGFPADPGLDFALIEITPQQQWLGSVTGTQAIQANIQYPSYGVRQYIVGYPSDGFWEQESAYFGQTQYACDSTYDFYEFMGSGFLLNAPCTMNRGSSGGPWFVEFSDGSWAIGAVTSQCGAPDDWKNPAESKSYCWPYSQYSRGAYFDNNFLTFWQSVQPLLKW